MKNNSPALVGLAAAVLCAGLVSCSKPKPATSADVPAPTAVSAPVPDATLIPVPAEPPVTVLPGSSAPGGPRAEEALRGYMKDVFFDFDRADLRPSDKEILAKNADWLNRREYAALRVVVEGHCDERGTASYNMALGERRASAVRDFLVSLGVDFSRVQILSYGKEKPFALGNDEAAWQQNRRAHFVVSR